ncbi:O-antigen ligase family protein [uncultured Algimonas sp.]|uniref:O-antigen ligase family protein n=1 Tax=uncultured Algimonas sp. TaxID=1547920 RepID=UPI002623198C|nr:O-antigen ligase family protein [uncultured Algimonas sp.]
MLLRRLLDAFASGWLLFWLALIAVYIHFGALAFAGLVILLGAVGWPVWLLHRKHLPVTTCNLLMPMAAFAAFFIWLAATSGWSDHGPDTALRLGGQMALAAAVPALIATRAVWTRILLSHLLMAMVIGGVAVLAMDVASGYGINIFLSPIDEGADLNQRQSEAEMNIGRGHVAYAVLAPLVIALFATRLPQGRAGPVAIGFVALLLVGTLLNRLAIAPIILVSALAFLYIGYHRPTAGLRLSLGALVGSVLFAPLVGIAARLSGEGLMARLPMSWDHRLRMWDYSLSRIGEAPWFGHGLDRSRTMAGDFTTRIGVDIPFVSLHPHNVGLQTWMETGLVGAFLLTLALVSLYRPLKTLAGGSPWRAGAVSGLLMGATVGGAVTVGAWQYWWWGLIVLALSLVLLIPAGARLSERDIISA